MPTENWIVPDYDCELDEVRGMIAYKQNLQLQSKNNQLQLDNNQLQLKIESLKLENSDLKQQIERLALHNPDASEKNTLNSSSINILKRFL